MLMNSVSIRLKVTPYARHNHIEVVHDLWQEPSLIIKVTAAPEQGKANKAVIELLSDYFHIAKSCFSISVGQKSRCKLLIIKASVDVLESCLQKIKNVASV